MGADGGTGGKDGGGELQPHPVKDQLPGVDFCVSSCPSWPEVVFLGFQHYLVMLGSTVMIPSILVPLMGGGSEEKAQMINTILFVSGISTLLQSLFGTRLPVVMGASYTFIIPTISISLSKRYDGIDDPHEKFIQTIKAIQGAHIMAAIFTGFLGFLGFWRIFARFLSPLTAAPLVILTGLGLFALGFPQLAKCIEIGLPALIALVFLSQYLPNLMNYRRCLFSRFAVLLSVAIIWCYAEILTAAGAYRDRDQQTQLSCCTDRAGLVSAAAWIKVPYPFQWGSPTFNAGDAFAMMAAAFVACVESTGTYIAASRYGSATPIPPSVLSRGIGWQGICILLGGFCGAGTGFTASVENAGLVGQTRVGTRRVVQISAGFMLFFSVLGKFGAFLASIPLPIAAALKCVLFAYVASAGLGLLQFCNLNSFRSNFILGFSLFMGLSVPQYFNEYLLKSGHGPVHTDSVWFNNIMQVILTSQATVGIIVAYFLDLTHSSGDGLVWKDTGRHWWEKFRNFSSDTRSDEFYSLPWNLNRFFPSF